MDFRCTINGLAVEAAYSERSVEEIRRRFGKAVIGRAAARLHTDLWSPDLEKTQVIHPIGLLKTGIS